MKKLVSLMLAVMMLDYITGLICGFKGASPKTENGGLSSKTAFEGLLKKAVILLIVFLAALLDRAVTMSAGVDCAAVTGATCLWFIASEGLSVVENAAVLGIKIPATLRRVLEIMREKGAGEEKQDEDH